jgi:hypothetical protein
MDLWIRFHGQEFKQLILIDNLAFYRSQEQIAHDPLEMTRPSLLRSLHVSSKWFSLIEKVHVKLQGLF